MRKNSLLRPVVAATASVGMALLFTACSDSDEADETPIDEPDEVTVEETEEPEADQAPPADEAQVAIGESFEDPELGDSIEVVSAVRDFASDEMADLIAGGGEVVLVEVTVVPGQEYGGLVSAGDFEISWDDGADFWNNKTSILEDEMDAAGYTPYEDVARRDGGEHTGWIAYAADEKSDTYLLQYGRAEAEVIGSDETIDAFEVEIEIPAP